jgi:release factor glutamine methyltransferase
MEPSYPRAEREQLSQLLNKARLVLAESGITGTPYLDSLLLLAHAAGMTREKLLSSLPETAPSDTAESFYKLISLRAAGRPAAYLLKQKEFYGHNFYIDERVLIPRPDTELLVETAINIYRSGLPGRSVLDLCSGSGCVGISVQAELPDAYVSLGDISKEALAVSTINAQKILGKTLPSYNSDLLEAIPGTFSLLTANPPYLTDKECTDPLLIGRNEPLGALKAGPDGLTVIRRLAQQGFAKLEKKGYLILECGSTQAGTAAEILMNAGFSETRIFLDLAGRERVVSGKKH